MEKIIKDFVGQLKIGKKQSFKNLSMYPLISDYRVAFDYYTLDEALDKKNIEILEVDESGSVSDLKVVNKSSMMALILGGEELVGAKQNRIINTTILVSGNSTIIIPVTCVEQGRWSYDGQSFSSDELIIPDFLRHDKTQQNSSSVRVPKAFYSGELMTPAFLRHDKTRQVSSSVRVQKAFYSDQCAMWSEISNKSVRHGAVSPTMDLGEIYEKEKTVLKEYLDGFNNIESQTGAVFMINEEIAGMDCFGKSETFSSVFHKLVKSYALDAIDWFDNKKEYNVPKSKVTKFLKETSKTNIDTQKSVGEGMDCRLETKKIAGSALCYDSQIPHMAVFAESDIGRPNSKMQRFSRRRNQTL